MKINLGDPHHCRCYSIDPQEIEDFRRELTNLGFTYEFQEDHGQVFGLALRVSEYLQLHIKVMPDGTIEGEMEPPPAYPFAHINPEHCYSAHKEIGELFDLLPHFSHKKKFPPIRCIRRIIKMPIKPTHAQTIAGLAIVAIGIGALYYLSKGKDGE